MEYSVEYFTLLKKNCITLFALVHGGYGNWKAKNACNVTCGDGFETWIRDCDNPEPKFGGRNCSLLGTPVDYRSCSARPCPGKIVKFLRKASIDRLYLLILSYALFLVHGGYSNWSVSIPCNVSCGKGVEIWKRTCDKPEPKYGGKNCSDLGSSTESKKCKRKPCPSN